MGWMTIRPATDDDVLALEQAAARFCKRHSLHDDLTADYGHITAIRYAITDAEWTDGTYLRNLWRRIVRRTLGHPWAEGIDYGYVGYYVD
jgi:hypothetical protein